MLKRLLPTLLALGAGLTVLAVGLVSLHGIFLRERDDGARALRERQAALEHYAHQALVDALEEELRSALPAMDAAVANPLLPADGLLVFHGGRQVLPRTAAAKADGARAVQTLYAALEQDGGAAWAAQTLEEDDPFRERLLLASRFLGSVRSGKRAEVERTFRELLSHRAHFVVSTPRDVTLMLWLLECFQAEGQPDSALMSALLRDGVAGVQGATLEGLQRTVLQRRAQFEAQDFAFVSQRLVALSELTHVYYADFQARAREQPAVALEMESFAAAPVLAHGYYVREGGPEARGVAVDVSVLRSEIRTRMVERGLLDASDLLSSADAGALATLRVTLSSPRTQAALLDLGARYRWKTALLFLTLALALGIVALAAVAQLRKQKFLALRSDFVSTVSHELKTPLSAIRVMAETLERRVGGKDGAGDYPTRIVQEADALTRLVENILTFNRLDKGRWDARVAQVALKDVVEGAAQDAQEKSGAQVELEAGALDGATVRADPELLRILFSNLAHNACRYSARTPVRLTVDAVRNGALCVRVRDNGVGIPREQWAAIFEEFRRLRPEGVAAKGGSGLGLAICKRIMTLHGGDIRVAESSPEGTTFELQFP